MPYTSEESRSGESLELAGEELAGIEADISPVPKGDPWPFVL